MLVLALLDGEVGLNVAGWLWWSNLYKCIFDEFFRQDLTPFLMILHLLSCTKAGSDMEMGNGSGRRIFVHLSSAVV